jgi:nucleolar protein 58
MVATKAALSIRVDALTDADGKSEDQAPSIGIENRAKLESRLRALEHQGDLAGVRRFADGGKKQQRFEMTGDTKTYNTAADAVDLVPTQREPMEIAVKAVLDVKEEKRRAKEERRAKKRAEKAVLDDTADDLSMDVDGEDKKIKEKKRKRRESEANGAVEEAKVSINTSSVNSSLHIIPGGGTWRDGGRAKSEEEGTQGGEGCCSSGSCTESEQ